MKNPPLPVGKALHYLALVQHLGHALQAVQDARAYFFPVRTSSLKPGISILAPKAGNGMLTAEQWLVRHSMQIEADCLADRSALIAADCEAEAVDAQRLQADYCSLLIRRPQTR